MGECLRTLEDKSDFVAGFAHPSSFPLGFWTSKCVGAEEWVERRDWLLAFVSLLFNLVMRERGGRRKRFSGSCYKDW